MKFFVVALSLAVICCVSQVTDANRQKALKLMQDCADELGITSEELHKYLTEIKNSDDEPKVQNLVKCFFQKINLIDQNGDFQESVAIQKMTTGENPIMTEENVKECTVTAGDNKANAFALKLYACYHETIKLSASNN